MRNKLVIAVLFSVLIVSAAGTEDCAYAEGLPGIDKPVVAQPDKKGVSSFDVTVNYGQSLAQMIAAGHYEVVAKEISSEHFPVHGKGKVDIKLVVLHFNREISIDEVMEEFDRLGYRAATLPELLALGAKYPDLQRQGFPIVEFGSLWRNNNIRVAAYLRGTPGYRAVDIYFVDDPTGGGQRVPWVKETRFLAVRK